MSEDKLPTPEEQALMFQEQLDQRIMEALNRKLDNMDDLAHAVSQKMCISGMRNQYVFELVSNAFERRIEHEKMGKATPQEKLMKHSGGNF